MFDALSQLGLLPAAAVFFLSALGVWVSGARLAYLADALSDELHLSKSLIGLLLLATATSLPEIATTLAAALRQNQALVLNNLYGGVALQTAILAVADYWVRGAITYYPRRMTHILEALLLVGLLSVTLILATLGEQVSFGWIGGGSLVIAVFYAGGIWLLRAHDPEGDWVPVDLPDEAGGEAWPFRGSDDEKSLTRMIVETAIAAGAILVCGLGLVLSAEQLARTTGLSDGFVGVSLLAAATSLPELTTSIAAVRLGAYTLAISNIFGSNLIMLVLVLPADLLYRPGPILRDMETSGILALGFGILVTVIYLVGMVIRRKPRIGRIGLDSALVFLVFLTSLVAYYAVS